MTSPRFFFRNVSTFVLVGIAVFAAIAVWLANQDSTGVIVSPRDIIAPPSDTAKDLASQVTIYRDEYGVPHIHGRTDAATAFGFAYAHSEDDFPLIQGSLIAARGQLSRTQLSKLAAANDFLVALLDVKAASQRQFDELPDDFKTYLNAYAEGLNLYAYNHPDEADARFLPISGVDILAGFAHKLPLMMGLGNVLQNLTNFTPEQLAVGQPLEKHFDFKQTMPDWFTAQVAGSNAHAVAKHRSSDNITRLNINSHQPWEGPVAWYEAHLISEQGLNIVGSTFPGAAMILHGRNQALGWAHTVNRPDFIDVYKLTVRQHPSGDSLQYQLDNKWLPLLEKQAAITFDLTLFEWTFNKAFFISEHGPVMQIEDDYYAIRLPGRESHGKASLQWHRMNKAQNMEQWLDAMRLQYVSMMNTVYADADNIFYLYNALMPNRNATDVDWRAILPGDRADLIWQTTLAFEQLPQVLNPTSGFVMNTNTTPFITTDGPGNPRTEDYAKQYGIEKIINNRGIRSHETFGRDESISRDEFLRYKFDFKYSAESSLYQELLNPLLNNYAAQSADETTALQLLREWDGTMSRDSEAATLVRLIHEPWHRARTFESIHTEIPAPEALLKNAIERLNDDFNGIKVPLGELQKLQRGDTELPIDGGVDTLYSVHTKQVGKHQVGRAGDSYILIAEFGEEQAESWSLHQYGNVNRPESPHYDDQATLFQSRQLRKTLFTLDEVIAHASVSYQPGKEPQ